MTSGELCSSTSVQATRAPARFAHFILEAWRFWLCALGHPRGLQGCGAGAAGGCTVEAKSGIAGIFRCGCCSRALGFSANARCHCVLPSHRAAQAVQRPVAIIYSARWTHTSAWRLRCWSGELAGCFTRAATDYLRWDSIQWQLKHAMAIGFFSCMRRYSLAISMCSLKTALVAGVVSEHL